MLTEFDPILILIAFSIMLMGLLKRWAVCRTGRPESFSGNWNGLISYILGHGRILDKRKRGIFHLLIFWGFVIPLLIIISAQFGFTLPAFASGVLSLLADFAGISLFVSTLYFFINRFRSGDEGGPKKTLFPLAIILAITVSGFLAEGLRLSITGSGFEWSSPFGWILSLAMPASPMLMQIMIRVHFLMLLLFIATIPFTFSRHLAAVPLNIFYKKRKHQGGLINIPLEKGVIGAHKVKEFSWKQLLNAEACVACGRCEENCPAFISGKPLSPRRIIGDIHNQMDVVLKGGQEEIRVSEDEIWSCTTCMACVVHCPVFAEPLDKIIDLRRYRVMGKGLLPQETKSLIRNLEIFGDVNGKGSSHRIDWAFNRNVDLVSSECTDQGILLWVGCSGAYHPRYREVSRAMAHILKNAGIRFSILGKDEFCCGDPARKLGEEDLFRKLAKKNIERLENYSVKEIITICPHCFNTLKNEYPSINEYSEPGKDMKWKVYHASEYIVKLINEKRIIPKYPINKSITFHDPCYLGRINDLYQPPREIIKNLPDARYRELGRHHKNGFCCGGGGGGMWLHEKLGRRMNIIRAEEVLETGADLLATACPYCLTMLDDGLKSLEAEKAPKVMDIVEILADSI